MNRSSFCNPVISRNRPDPSLTFTAVDPLDGTTKFWCYSTRNYGSEVINVPVECGRDLASFEFAGDAVPQRPLWALQSRVETDVANGFTEDVGKNYWAPHCVVGDGIRGEQGRYYLFGCCRFNDEGYVGRDDSGTPIFEPKGGLPRLEPGFALYVATSDSPRGPFHDSGRPLEFGPGFSVLDPMVFMDPLSGLPYLLWGSHNQPISIRQLSNDLLSFAPGSETMPILDVGSCLFESLREGAFLMFNERSEFPYQLYVSGDNVWEDGKYGVTVHVSKKLFGPYRGISELNPERKDNVVIRPSSVFDRTGHNSIFRDAEGNDFIIYHGMAKSDPLDPTSGETLRMMLVDPLLYDSMGFPYVEAFVPSTTPQRSPSM